MAVRINTNVDALDAQRHLSMVSADFSSAVAKLSSGLRINTAADDAAGLAISQKLTSQVNGFDQGGRNAQDAISLIQTGEGALNTTHSMLQRMRQLAVQAANDSYTNSDRANIQAEINQLIQEVDRIAQQTDFNTKKLLDGSAGGAQLVGGGPDIKQIQAQAQVALNGTIGIVAANGPGIGAANLFQAVKGGGTGAALLIAGGSTLNIAAGNGTNYAFSVDATGTKLSVTGTGGRGNGFTTTAGGTGGVPGNQVQVSDFVALVNALPGSALSATIVGGTNLVINDRTAGVVSTSNPGGPQVLALTNSSGDFAAGGQAALGNLTAAGSVTAAAGGGGFNIATPATVISNTSVATRSAIESGNVSNGSTFTQTSSITITGGRGTQTFTAQAGEAMSTFFQQVNGSGIGATMAIDQNNGKVVIYNNDYGITGTDRNGNTNSTGATQVSMTSATGDFTATGLNMNFTSAVANTGSVDSNLTFGGGNLNTAVNAQVTMVDPTGAAGYRTISATGQNSDQLGGVGGLSGINIVLANPGVIQGDNVTINENAALNFQVGANANQTVALNIDAATSQVLGVTSLSLLTTQSAETAITQLDRAIQAVSTTRAQMGAVINRLQNSVNNDAVSSENASAANSRIKDVDVARQTVDFTRDQILLQAGTAVLAQANQAPTSILSLLR